MFANRILSGMRPTGSLHLGHYHGVIKNWVQLQSTHDCYFMVADWHALTTNYDDVSIIGKSVWDMVIDWLAAGVNPSRPPSSSSPKCRSTRNCTWRCPW